MNFPALWTMEFLLKFIIYPFISTILFFWIFPYITRIYYRKSIKNEKILRKIELQEAIQMKRQEKQVIKEEVEIIDEGIRKAKAEKKAEAETPEVIWKREFQDFKKSEQFEKFNQIIESIYENRGFVEWDRFKLDTGILVYSDSHGITTFDDKASRNKISLTEKGRYFVSLYSEEINQNPEISAV